MTLAQYNQAKEIMDEVEWYRERVHTLMELQPREDYILSIQECNKHIAELIKDLNAI